MKYCDKFSQSMAISYANGQFKVELLQLSHYKKVAIIVTITIIKQKSPLGRKILPLFQNDLDVESEKVQFSATNVYASPALSLSLAGKSAK